MKHIITIFTSLVLFSASCEAQTPQTITTFNEMQSSEKIGLQFIEYIFQKEFKKAADMVAPNVKDQISEQVIMQIAQQLEQNIGAYIENLEINVASESPMKSINYYSKFEKHQLDVKVTFDENNKIVGFFLLPHQVVEKKVNSQPDYTVKVGDINLPGTLLIAKENNKNILTIFVHGSGPNDRNETIGNHQLFKDIAEHLLKEGISSYRFDKKTKISPEFYANKAFTIDDEVTDDVCAIVQHFKNDATYKNYKIVLIGHSLGAMMTPRIINQNKSDIAGAIMLAGNARPLQDLIVEQYEYINNLDSNKTLDNEIKRIKEQVAIVNSNALKPNTTAQNMPLGLPASYWISLKNYNQVAIAKQLNTPLYIVQGAHDYQVTMQDFNLWQQSLKQKSNIHFKSYPLLNHLFFETEKMSIPADYQKDGTTPQYFLEDLSNWIIKNIYK